MEAGELELRKVFEEVTTKNVQTILEYGKETRRISRELEDKVYKLEGVIRLQNETIERLKIQLSTVQAALYRGGTE